MSTTEISEITSNNTGVRKMSEKQAWKKRQKIKQEESHLSSDLRNIFYTESFVVFFFTSEKNPQFNFSSQNPVGIERNFFKWDGKVTKIWHILFHRIFGKNIMLVLSDTPIFFL